MIAEADKNIDREMPRKDTTNEKETDTSILSQEPPPLTNSQSRKVRDNVYKSISQSSQATLLQEALKTQRDEIAAQLTQQNQLFQGTVTQLSQQNQLFQGAVSQLRDKVARRDQALKSLEVSKASMASSVDAKIQEILP